MCLKTEGERGIAVADHERLWRWRDSVCRTLGVPWKMCLLFFVSL